MTATLPETVAVMETTSEVTGISIELTALLESDSIGSRVLACKSLARLGERALSALPALRAASHDPHPRVRAAAEAAIVVIFRAIHRSEQAEAGSSTRWSRFLDNLLRSLGSVHS